MIQDLVLISSPAFLSLTPLTLPEGLSCNRINSHSISREEVHKALTDLDVSKGSGQDDPNLLLKSLATEFADPLELLLNRSLSTGSFPALGRRRTSHQFSKVETVHAVSRIEASLCSLRYRSSLSN